MTKRLGFACKFMHPNKTLTPKQRKEFEEKYNTKTTTRAWMSRQPQSVAESKLWEIIRHNLWATKNLIKYAGDLPSELRFVRISSDLLPLYTEPTWSYFYKKPDVVKWLEHSFADLGNTARNLHCRVSMHPGQFCVLASDNPDVVTNSIAEFEYHCDMIRWMGYGQQFQDFSTNVHIGGKLGPDGIRSVYPKLSTEARNTITIENDEFGWGLDSCLELSDIIPIVLDIHHYWIREEKYIMPDDIRYNKVIESWNGVRPKIHYSYSRCEHLPENFDHSKIPEMSFLLEEGFKKSKLRAHSDYYPNNSLNDYALSFLETADIMCESKMKNVASINLYEYAKKAGFI